MTHDERRERRRQIASATGTAKEVAVRFGVTDATVYTSRKEFNMSAPTHQWMSPSQIRMFKILRAVIDGDGTDSEIARRFDVQRQYVYLVKRQAKEAGWPIKFRRQELVFRWRGRNAENGSRRKNSAAGTADVQSSMIALPAKGQTFSRLLVPPDANRAEAFARFAGEGIDGLAGKPPSIPTPETWKENKQ